MAAMANGLHVQMAHNTAKNRVILATHPPLPLTLPAHHQPPIHPQPPNPDSFPAFILLMAVARVSVFSGVDQNRQTKNRFCCR